MGGKFLARFSLIRSRCALADSPFSAHRPLSHLARELGFNPGDDLALASRSANLPAL